MKQYHLQRHDDDDDKEEELHSIFSESESEASPMHLDRLAQTAREMRSLMKIMISFKPYFSVKVVPVLQHTSDRSFFFPLLLPETG